MEAEEHTREAEDVTALLRVWPDVERNLLEHEDLADLADAVRQAFRIEASSSAFGGTYSLFFDVERPEARRAATVAEGYRLKSIADDLLPGVLVMVQVRMVSERKPWRARFARAS